MDIQRARGSESGIVRLRTLSRWPLEGCSAIPIRKESVGVISSFVLELLTKMSSWCSSVRQRERKRATNEAYLERRCRIVRTWVIGKLAGFLHNPLNGFSGTSALS
jgi:hypothetical protein